MGENPENEDTRDTQRPVPAMAYKRAMEWRLQFIAERRAARLTHSKARALKAQSKLQRHRDLKSKALLLGETEAEWPLDSAAQEDSSPSSDEGVLQRPRFEIHRRVSSGSESDSDDLEPYWSIERGFEWRAKERSSVKSRIPEEAAAKAKEDEIMRHDKYFLYSMLVITVMCTTLAFLLVVHALIIDGTIHRVATLFMHGCFAAIIAFLVIIQCMFLYEHYTQAPAFLLLSSGFTTSWLLLWPILYVWPQLGVYSLAGGVLATFLFSVLGLSAKPSTLFPIFFQPFFAYVCHLCWPVFKELWQLLFISCGDVGRLVTQALHSIQLIHTVF